MTNIDKNPRQITRLRVEDQKKLEKLASVTEFNEGDYTTQLDGSLNVNGTIKAQEAVIYNDSQLTFYQGDSETAAQSANISISPLFGDIGTVTQLAFTYTLPDGAESYSAYLDLDKTSNILTDKNVKTLFGNSLYGTGNINLYVHYLSIIAGSKFYNGVVYSSNNIAADSPQKLTTLFKATSGTAIDCIILSDIDSNTVGLLKWNGDIWQIQLANDNFVTVTSVTDRVEPM